MISFETRIRVDGLVAYRLYRFFLQPGGAAGMDPREEVGLRLHMLRRDQREAGSVVGVDERIGDRRIRSRAVITDAVPGRRIVLRMRKVVPLPAWVVMEFEDVDGGVEVTHTVNLGYRGVGVLLDPFLYLYFSRQFREALRKHLQREFARLERILYIDTSEW